MSEFTRGDEVHIQGRGDEVYYFYSDSLCTPDSVFLSKDGSGFCASLLVPEEWVTKVDPLKWQGYSSGGLNMELRPLQDDRGAELYAGGGFAGTWRANDDGELEEFIKALVRVRDEST